MLKLLLMITVVATEVKYVVKVIEYDILVVDCNITLLFFPFLAHLDFSINYFAILCGNLWHCLYYYLTCTLSKVIQLLDSRALKKFAIKSIIQ